MSLREYIHGLDSLALDCYAKRCAITTSYMRLHVKYAKKDPSVALIKALTRESGGSVSLSEVLEHFEITELAIRKKAT